MNGAAAGHTGKIYRRRKKRVTGASEGFLEGDERSEGGGGGSSRETAGLGRCVGGSPS